jgi:hypothetical protein
MSGAHDKAIGLIRLHQARLFRASADHAMWNGQGGIHQPTPAAGRFLKSFQLGNRGQHCPEAPILDADDAEAAS